MIFHKPEGMIEAVIFDMDGLLINSEPLWRKAEISVFRKLGIDFTDAMCLKTVGYRIDEVVAYWRKFYDLGEDNNAIISNHIIDELIVLINDHGVEMNGVHYILNFFRERNIKIAIATSSAYRIIDAVMEKLNIRNYFEGIHSAEHEVYGKPHPAVYLHAAGKVNAEPSHCLAFEDSFNGILSAKAARMKCVAVPEPHNYFDNRFIIADCRIHSLNDFTEEHWHTLNQH